MVGRKWTLQSGNWLKCSECGRFWYLTGDKEKLDHSFKAYLSHMVTEHGQTQVIDYGWTETDQ